MRYLADYIARDIRQKMIILSGPRQSGKTTLARHIISECKGSYYNWDIREDQKIIRDMLWDSASPVVGFDELHKFNKWKNFLKGIYDQNKNRQSYLVTGSARLETFRKSGDALTGRFYHYRLHPLDIHECGQFFNKDLKLTSTDILSRLLETGGFPEAYLNPHNAARLRNNRFDLVLQEDLHDLSRVNSIRPVSILIELLRERVGGTLNYENLARELSVSAPTVKTWIELLERLYIIFLVYPYTKGLSRSLKKECKAYFYDCSSAYNGTGARLENLVACSLIKYLNYLEDTQGIKGRLCYFRDREKREVDFVVETDRQVRWIIEVKTDDESLNKNILYLGERVKPVESIQLVMNLSSNKKIKDVHILKLSDWLDEIYHDRN